MTDITLSDQQSDAVKAIKEWFKGKSKKPFFFLAGYAGTGKTTLAKIIAEEIGIDDVIFGAYTGKAAIVLRNKGCDEATTIHSMCYIPQEDKEGNVTYVMNFNSPAREAKLIIIDECSMVNEELAVDLLRFQIPVLVLGDTAQLPPVGGEGYFTKDPPDFMLTEIHRQARENPIIAMSMLVRAGKQLPIGVYGSSRVISAKKFDSNDVLSSDQVLCGRNITRTNTNARIRQLKLFEGKFPILKEKLVCLKNNRKKGLFNGSLWETDKIVKTYANAVTMKVSALDEGLAKIPVEVYVHEIDFTGAEDSRDWKEKKKYDSFTFGYCLTVHKSQGSQWNDVMIFDESGFFQQDRDRWLYTAITRAAEKTTIVV